MSLRIAAQARPVPPRRRAGLRDILALARQRRALRALDEARLQDLGLTRHEAEAEARRPVWDAPDAWIKARR